MIDISVGQEFIPLRLVHDVDRLLRLSFTIKPFVRSYPQVHPLWLEQSVEYFPWGGEDDPHHFSPYIAFGMDESGIAHHPIQWTFHGQVGAYIGNHFSHHHQQSLRIVLGYYHGIDPRLKYFELRNAQKSFGYLGLMLDL